MFKKTVATVLSALMLMMLCTVSSADTPEVTRLFDDFSQVAEELTTTFQNYPSGANTTSEIYSDKQYVSMYQIVDVDPSESTNMAMKIVVPNANVTTQINRPELAENEIMRYSFDFMMDGMATVATANTTTEGLFSFGSTSSGTTRFTIFPTKNGDGTITYKLNQDWSNRCTVEQGKWYKMVFYLKSDLKTLSMYFVDGESGEVLYSVEDLVRSSAVTFHGFNINKNTFGTVGGYFILDNVEVMKYALTDSPEMFEKSVSNGDENIARNTPLEFSFNQKISGSATLSKVTESGEVPVTVTQKIISAYNKLILNYEGLLDRNSTYKLSFSGISSANGASSEEITFKTEEMHLLNEVSVSGAVPNEGKTDVTFKISDPLLYPTFSGMVMAAVFEGDKMLAADIVSVLNAPTETEKTLSFSLGTVPENAEIQIMLLDAEKKVTPLAAGSIK